MPLVIGYNVHPNFPAMLQDGRPAKKTGGAVELGETIERVTREFWALGPNDVTCSFPFDPSVPTDPFPCATFIVDLLFVKIGRTGSMRTTFARQLHDAVLPVVNRIRDTEDARVEIAVRTYAAATQGFYVTPAPDDVPMVGAPKRPASRRSAKR